MKKVILVGFFQEMVELCFDCGLEIIGAIDSDGGVNDREFSIPFLGNDADAIKIYQKFKDAEIVITPDDPRIRKRLANYYRSIGFSFATIIHPLATISPTAQVGEGVIIQKGANVSANTKVGAFCRLNTHCNVMHDVIVGGFTTIAPDAVLLGYVTIGESCYIGANCTVLPECSIGNEATIGAGAVVTKNVDSMMTVAGVPAVSLH